MCYWVEPCSTLTITCAGVGSGHGIPKKMAYGSKLKTWVGDHWFFSSLFNFILTIQIIGVPKFDPSASAQALHFWKELRRRSSGWRLSFQLTILLFLVLFLTLNGHLPWKTWLGDNYPEKIWYVIIIQLTIMGIIIHQQQGWPGKTWTKRSF